MPLVVLRPLVGLLRVCSCGAIVLVLLIAGCRHAETEGLPPGTTLEDLPEGESWDVHLRSTQDGRPTLEIDAPYLARYQRPDTTYIYLGPPPADSAGAARVRVRLFDGGGAPQATVEAAQAWFYPSDGRLVAEGAVRAEVTGGGGARIEAPGLTARTGGAFTATGGATADLAGRAQARVRARTISGLGGRYEADGGAVVETSSGRRLESGRVVWSETAGRFSAPGAFAFTGPAERIRGVDLSATADLSRYTFRRASGQIEVQE